MADASDKCPKCDRKMLRQTTAFVSIYVCTKCEKDALVQAVKLAATARLKPPT
jgi:ribosomal protein L37AE/L43A